MSITIIEYGGNADATDEEDIKHSIWDILWTIYGGTKDTRKEAFSIPRSISRGDVIASFWGDTHPLLSVTRDQVGHLMDVIYRFVVDYGPREIATARIEVGGHLAMWFELEFWTSTRRS